MEFLSLILWIIGAIVTWSMISHGFAIARRIAVATETTAMSTAALYYALTPEAKERADATLSANAKEKLERNTAIAERKDKRFFITIIVVGILLMLFWMTGRAHAQGIYMGRDGRAHAQVIVGPDGRGWPVAPTFCTPGFGPCPVVLAPPLAYAPAAPMAPSAQEPLGWVYGPYTACGDPPACSTGVVSVQADGLNVRTAPDGQPVMALVNGTPLIPLGREGNWLLVAAACDLTPTFLWSWTVNVPLNRCWVY